MHRGIPRNFTAQQGTFVFRGVTKRGEEAAPCGLVKLL